MPYQERRRDRSYEARQPTPELAFAGSMSATVLIPAEYLFRKMRKTYVGYIAAALLRCASEFSEAFFYCI